MTTPKASPAAVLATLGSHTYPVPDTTLLTKKVERAYKWSLHIDNNLNPKWSCSIILVEIEEKPFAKGSCRTAHKLKDLSHPTQQFVAKFSSKKASRDMYFMDVVMQTFCSKWSDLYNASDPPKKVTFLPSFVLDLVDRPTPTVAGAEPFISGEYKKHNNNSGYVNSEESRNTPQAFSHFSLVHSNLELLIIDVQGVNDFYTDPQIHTKSGKGFGEGNLGQNGIHQFVKTHTCNPLCSYLKMEPLNQSQSKRMLLRGTLPVVQLALDVNSGTAIITPESPPIHAVPHPLGPGHEHKNHPVPRASPVPAAASSEEEDARKMPPPAARSKFEDAKAADSNSSSSNGSASKSSASSSPAASEIRAAPIAVSEKKWDLKNFKLIETIRGNQAECITADDKNLYSGSGDGQISIWDPVEMKLGTSFKASSKSIKCVLMRGQDTLFSSGSDGVIREWDLNTQNVKNDIKEKSEINSVFLTDSLLFSGSNDKTVKIYDSRSYAPVATLASHSRAVKTVYVLGNYVFSGSNDQQVLVWSLQTNTVLTNLQGHEGWIKSLVGLGTNLYSGSHDETVRVWDLNTLQCTNVIKTKDKVEALLITPQALVTAAGDFVEFWDPADKYSNCLSVNARTSVLCLTRHQNRVFAGSIGNHLKVWSCE